MHMAWGYGPGGYLWCDTCGGDGGVPCPEDHVWNTDIGWWEDCSRCDIGFVGEDHDPTINCPDCASDNPDTYVGT
jgi:hypothetical protein